MCCRRCCTAATSDCMAHCRSDGVDPRTVLKVKRIRCDQRKGLFVSSKVCSYRLGRF